MISDHAQTRIRQRGLKEEDLLFIVENGSPAGDGYLLTSHDAQEIVASAKRQIALAERLKNKLAIVRDDVVVTAFTPTRQQLSRRLRN